jgi:hypothetical protein
LRFIRKRFAKILKIYGLTKDIPVFCTRLPEKTLMTLKSLRTLEKNLPARPHRNAAKNRTADIKDFKDFKVLNPPARGNFARECSNKFGIPLTYS